jgi:glyoxylase-like metal-dependent hydrolase (beta-lactamase superfamily II)
MQITKHIHTIKIPFQIAIAPGIKVDRFVYVYLIYGKKIYLIDTGVATSEKIIFDYIRKTGRNPEDISLIVLTHSHPDHIGAAHEIQRATGCTVAAHYGERSWIEDVELQHRERPVPGFHSLVGGSVMIDRILENGDILDLDGIRLEVFHTPGHSRGSISLLLPEDGALFTGDSIPLAKDLPIYDDVLESVRSIKKIKAIDGIEFLLSSWDDPKKGINAYQIMDEALSYLARIHEAVTGVDNNDLSHDPMELCRLVLRKLKMPEMTANPLIARSFEAHRKVSDHKDLMKQ